MIYGPLADAQFKGHSSFAVAALLNTDYKAFFLIYKNLLVVVSVLISKNEKDTPLFCFKKEFPSVFYPKSDFMRREIVGCQHNCTRSLKHMAYKGK